MVHDGITFNKKDILHNLTLFLYPDDSDEDGRKLRVYQQYFMVSNAAQLILDEAVSREATFMIWLIMLSFRSTTLTQV